MYSISVILKGNPTALNYVFKAYKNADEAYRRLITPSAPSTTISIEDDYDARGVITIDQIAAVHFLDLNKDGDKNAELSLLMAKSQMKANNLARSDVGMNIMIAQ